MKWHRGRQGGEARQEGGEGGGEGGGKKAEGKEKAAGEGEEAEGKVFQHLPLSAADSQARAPSLVPQAAPHCVRCFLGQIAVHIGGADRCGQRHLHVLGAVVGL